MSEELFAIPGSGLKLDAMNKRLASHPVQTPAGHFVQVDLGQYSLNASYTLEKLCGPATRH